ncbi:MAG: hypothetical protein M0Q37_07745 [Sphaerochaeta sp.]|nr:hypothetical protein [Sphaerochaeta sp.]
MRKLGTLMLLVLIVPSLTLLAAVSSASLGGFYSYEQITQRFSRSNVEDRIEGTTIGLALRGSTFFKNTGKFGLRYDLRAGKMMNLRIDGKEVDTLGTIGMDVGVGVAYQQPITYVSFIEAGLGIRAAGGMRDYSQGGADMVDNHAFLGIAAFLDYNHALLNKLVLNIGANAKMPLVGYAKIGPKADPTEGAVTMDGIKISPYVGVSYVF